MADTVGPELTVPPSLFVPLNAPGGANVTFHAPTAVDLVDANPVLVCDAISGFFPLGITTVTCTATDAAGNGTIAKFPVIVSPLDPMPTAFWDGGGDNDNWSNSLNWVGDLLPGPADDVLIGTGFRFRVDFFGRECDN